jgi:N-methylhydantoinase B/oxoprolinase/acetone carboxylase alpha subunit
VITMRDAGGGGVGDPAARDPAHIRADLAAGLITRGFAARYYKQLSSP